MWFVVSIYGDDLEFIDVCYNSPLFFENADVIDGSFRGKGAVIWIENMGDNLGNVVGVCLCGLLVGEGRCH